MLAANFGRNGIVLQVCLALSMNLAWSGRESAFVGMHASDSYLTHADSATNQTACRW